MIIPEADVEADDLDFNSYVGARSRRECTVQQGAN